MKRIIAICVILMMTLSMTVAMTACSKGAPPALEDVYDRLVQVIEESYDVNVALFGIGLPVYERDSAESALTNRYYQANDNGMEYVDVYHSKYQTIEAIKEAACRVYSQSYRESVFESTFTGYAMSEGGGSVLPARYMYEEGVFYQSLYVNSLFSGQRTYDYGSIEILGGHATYIEISIRSYLSDRPGEWFTEDLSFVYEDGNWYLDGPSC